MSHFQGPNDFENILTDFEPDSIDYLGAESSINYDLLGAEPLIDYSNPDLNSAEHILDDSIAFEGSLTPEEKPFGFEDGWPEWDELFGPEGMSSLGIVLWHCFEILMGHREPRNRTSDTRSK